MASYTKFQPFVEKLAEKAHNLGSDTLKVALTNTAPSAANGVYTDLTSPLATTNLAGGTPFNLTTSSSAQSAGTYKLVIADLVLTASGGSVGPFRYIVIYNDTATNDELIAFYDYGSSVTLADGDTFTINFDDSNGLLQLA